MTIEARMEERPAFNVIGRKTWIAGMHDEYAFGLFWEECKANGLFQVFSDIRQGQGPGPVTNGLYLGVSRVEKCPTNRSFFFYIGIEGAAVPEGSGLETFEVAACKWAIFRTQGPMPEALVAAEMYAFGEWLPQSGFEHALVPELEVYPPYDGPDDQMLVEFWLPVVDKQD